MMLVALLAIIPPTGSFANGPSIRLGNELLLTRFYHLIEGKRIGLVTNQTGVNSKGVSTVTLLSQAYNVSLNALYAPEHGLDGKTPAGQYVSSTTHPTLHIPVYSLYGKTRMPTKEMLASIDVLLFDLQDIGARSYTYMSTLHYCMKAAKQEGKTVIVLDRPNPLGGTIVEGPVAEDKFLSFVGVDNLPMAHGMTAGELALFFNRKIGVDLIVVPMEGYTRHMIFQDTGLNWVASSPRIPHLNAVFGYMATGLGEGTGIFQADDFSWIGGKGIDSQKFSNLMNFANLSGVVFTPETRGTAGGVRLNIYDPHLFNPAKTGLYALAYARSLNSFPVPKSGKEIVMFDKIMGTDKIGFYLEKNMSPEEIAAHYADGLAAFYEQRKQYLIYGDEPYLANEVIVNKPLLPSVPQPKPQTGEPPKPQPAPMVPKTKPASPPSVNPASKVAYLTFDDGPSPITSTILDILKEQNVKATFFVVGRNVKGNEKLLQRAVAEGHVIGGHTYSHNYRTIYRSSRAFFEDLELGNKAIADATGIAPTVFRYPGGSSNTVSLKYQDPAHYSKTKTVMADILKEARKRKYHFIDWNVSNGDASSHSYTAESALLQVKQQAANKREIVILMHDTAPKHATAQALPAIIQYLKAQGYSFRVLSADTPSVAYVK